MASATTGFGVEAPRRTGEKQKQWSHNSPIRFVVLSLSSFFLFARFYLYDSMTALQVQVEKDFHVGSVEYNLLFTMYNIPNVVAPMVGGLLADRIGLSTAMTVYAGALVCTSTVILAGAYINSFSLVLVGRFLSGPFGESLGGAQGALMSKWFGMDEFAMATALSTAIARAGTFVTLNLQPYFYHHTGENMGNAAALATAMVFLGLLSAIAVMIIDRKTDEMHNDSPDEVEKYGGFEVLHGMNWRDEWNELKRLPRLTWMIAIYQFFYMLSLMTFMYNLNEFFMERYDMSHQNSSFVQSIIFLVSVTLLVPFGMVIDRIGHRVTMMGTAPLILVVVLLLMSVAKPNAEAAMVFTGISFALFKAASWPSALMAADESQRGTAGGTGLAAVSAANVIGPLIVGVLRSVTGNYDLGNLILAGNAGMAVMLSLAMFVEDGKKDNILQKRHEKLSFGNEDARKESEPLLS